ncbi:uncharacterized protein SPPG_05487 [Spizellomyces punctatus DAOM BR117]|uniref:Uncharacterized protein n=1 Tax=Spizellomyces punctatus (strain DAOM BR117) TaxID=645134 RepID=A0A0L0HCF8_SPIPD|nr:uncharacterized protein SPPG_05487 [Spizellomyces punctatus DAOM BR117]KNC99230.1 hypothetical protein SPPG_05487 [Spizellomyces punctatus DAOM BR117]|eukprot:XP_016607270.1 hypothetical protein SPPG_05487 [Spizellomyces punctatus DAOM BR117]
MSSDIEVTEVRRVPSAFTYKRSAKNGVILNFQPSSQVRFEPTNGSGDCRPGGKLVFKIADDKRFWLVNETLHKYRVVGLKADGLPAVAVNADYRLCQSGTDAVWKRQSLLINGRIIEDLNDYNLFTVHENALTSWETKQHLGQCEYYSSEDNNRSAVVAQNNAYTVTGSLLSFFQNEVAFPLCLVKGGVSLEMTAETDLSKIFPKSTGITSFKVEQNKLICQFAEPVKAYYDKVLALMQAEDPTPLTIPTQIVWSQEFAGQDRMERFPQGKAIGHGSEKTGFVSTIDPEMYALSQRNKDFNDVKFAPTMSDLKGWDLGGKKIKHWSWRQNFKQTPDMIGSGLQTLADGRILINVSQYPNPPETADFPSETITTGTGDSQTTSPNPAYIPTFKNKMFHVFWTTDHVMSIDKDGIRLVPA